MLQEPPEYAKIKFYMVALLDVLGKIAWVDFLSQGKISDIFSGVQENFIWHARYQPVGRIKF